MKSLGDEDRRRGLEAVEEKGQCGEQLASGPQDVRCPDIARADIADVAFSRDPGQQQTKWDRPQEIAKCQGKEHFAGHQTGW